MWCLRPQITIQQIDEFGARIKEFKDKFKLEGPGAVGRDLDLGTHLLNAAHYSHSQAFPPCPCSSALSWLCIPV